MWRLRFCFCTVQWANPWINELINALGGEMFFRYKLSINFPSVIRTPVDGTSSAHIHLTQQPFCNWHSKFTQQSPLRILAVALFTSGKYARILARGKKRTTLHLLPLRHCNETKAVLELRWDVPRVWRLLLHNYVRRRPTGDRISLTWFRASFAKSITSVLFWNTAQRRVVIPYRRFGTTYQSHLEGSRKPNSWPSTMGLVGCPHTSLSNYHHTLRNIPEHRRSRVLWIWYGVHANWQQ